jgi:D-glycero-alpha-D-manno-heptose-7-phosphate kinase
VGLIITRTPFRVSFCGGGSDLPPFYEKYGGCVLSTSINKYIYISVHPYFEPRQTVLKYSKTEIVDDISQIEHRIFNCALNDAGISGVEITSTADIPAGTGLGSSSAFTVGLLHALSCYKGKYASKSKLAEKACDIEIKKLGSPIGKQDQYAAALGGLNFIRFHADGSVSHSPVVMRSETKKRLQENLCMFYLGSARSANDILAEQSLNISDAGKAGNLAKMCRLAEDMKLALESGDLLAFGEILHSSWLLKRSLASGITSHAIDGLYEKAIGAGATGGKLLGAGGGGFLLFFCDPEKQERLRLAVGLRQMRFALDSDGTAVIFIGEKYWD